MATPYMNLTLPTVSVTPGPLWATLLNAAITTIDSHDHSTGNGAPITPTAVSINANLPFNSFSATELTSIVLESQAAAIATPLSYYIVAGNPVFNNGSASAGRLVDVSFPLVTGDTIYASSTTAFGRLAIGTTGQVLKVSAGLPSWASPGASLAISDEASASFTAAASVDLYLCSRSGTQAVTLPVTTGGGKQFTFKKTSTALASIITISRAAADVIVDSAASVTSTTLNTLGEDLVLVDVAVGTWQVINRRVPSLGVAYTPTYVGFGTVSITSAFYKRIGDSLSVIASFTTGTHTGVAASISLPTGLSIDTAKILANDTSNAGQLIGSYSSQTAAQCGNLVTATTTSATVIYFGDLFSLTNKLIPQLGTGVMSNASQVSVSFAVPISGWNA